jgi:hypothetical protein
MDLYPRIAVPSKVYTDNARINPKHVKKLTVLEDLVQEELKPQPAYPDSMALALIDETPIIPVDSVQSMALVPFIASSRQHPSPHALTARPEFTPTRQLSGYELAKQNTQQQITFNTQHNMHLVKAQKHL